LHINAFNYKFLKWLIPILLKLTKILYDFQLSTTGERSTSEIAYPFGFEISPYFSWSFPKEVGISPTEFMGNLQRSLGIHPFGTFGHPFGKSRILN